MNALKVVALRLQGMKGALEELNEPVDDLMEVSKIQTQILNLTQNQVDIYDQANDKFRSTYDILKDVSEIWDTLSSTERASLTEIMFGKLRANQGLAIIQAFQSGQIEKAYEASINAAGTATKENEEMMKGIQAHINALRGAFEELSNAVIDSNFLKTVIDSGKTIVEILTWITKNLGTLTTIGAGVGLFAGFKNVGLFNLSAIKEATVAFTAYNTQLKIGNQHLATQTALQGTENASLRTYIANLNGAKASLGSYTTYLVKTKIETIALRVATIALNTALTMGISLAIQGIGKLVDKLVITKDELNEISDTAVNDMNELTEGVKALNSEKAEVEELVQQYQELTKFSGDAGSKKEALIKIQDSLVEKFGDEAKGIDLVNGKYDEQIAKIKELSDEEYKKWKIKNADKIAEAEKMANYNVGWVYNDHGDLVEEIEGRNQVFLKGWVEHSDKLAASLYKVKGVSEDIQDIWQDIDGIDFVDGIISNDLYLSGTLEDAKNQLSELIAKLKAAGADADDLKPLTDQFAKIDKALKDINTYTTESEKLGTFNIYEGTANIIDELIGITAVSGKEMKTAWLKNLDEMQKGSLKNISTMVSALQDLSEGKGIAANTFWQLVEFDTEGLLNGAKLVGDKFYVAEENLVKIKDQYIQKQIESIELTQTQIATDFQAANEQVKLYERLLSENAKNPAAYQKILGYLEIAKANAKAYGDEWVRNNQLIQYLNQTLGNTVDLEKQLQAQQKALNKEITALNNELDDILKAQEHQIDSIVKGLEIEQSNLEAQKEALEDELDVLEKQKDTLEEIVGNYDKVNTLVQNTLQKEIDALEAEKDSIEEAYKKRIDALKEENEQRSDALEYAQKLANLENAKNNKVRVIDSTRGFRYESVKEDVVKAEKELKDYETEKEIKQLEKERDAEIKVRDERIKNIEAYAKDWKNMAQDVTDAQTEIIAQELLGSNWREEITNLDIETLKKFRGEYTNHNNALNNLTNNEIKLKKAAIDAKNAEIDAKKRQIEVWQNYKKEVQNAVQDIKNEYSTYMEKLGTVEIDEKSNLDRREHNLDTFKNNVRGIIDKISEKQAEVDRITASLEGLESKSIGVDVTVTGIDELEKAANEAAKLAAASAATYTMADEVRRRQVQNAGEEIAQMGEDIIKRISGLFGYSEGGVADYTGLAMLHGRKNAPETIFNANDSAKLYEMVHNTPNLMADMIDKATKISGFNLANASNNTQNSNEYSFYINKIVTDNPQDFAKQLDRYYQTKLTESYTNK